jgi:crotonobetainyl-CoA:carnitine CoA-transferase CaiB-like acyl-CoA transferase
MSALQQLWAMGNGRAAALDTVHLSGHDPALPSSFRVGTLAQATIAAAGLAAAEIWRQRTGDSQTVGVDMRHAAIEYRSERYVRISAPPQELWDKIAGLYRTRDGGWVRIHTNFPHHRDGILGLLGAEYTRESVQEKLLGWDGEAFETAAAARDMVATMLRSQAEWAAHPQGQTVSQLPVFEIVKIGDAPPRTFTAKPTRPLSGVRVLDLTRIIAGPVAGRTLAVHGADVLYVTSPHLPSIAVMDVVRGKRPAFIDLAQKEGRKHLLTLARDGDVFLEGYRPGGLSAKGFSPEALAAASPGIVYTTLSAYSHVGPWATRRGFDSLTQNANGLNVAEAEALAGGNSWERPKELPAQALDHGAGFILAFGTMLALARQREQGGSWMVRTSLAQVGEWLKSLGRIDNGLTGADPTFEMVQDLLETTASGYGEMRAVRHAALLSATPARYAHNAAQLGSYNANWA